MRGPARRWAIDSEFLSGDKGGEVVCTTFSNGTSEGTFLFWAYEKEAMYRFIDEHKFYYLFVWNLAPEYGSLQELDAELDFDEDASKIGDANWVIGDRKILLKDVQPFFKTMGKELGSLENAGKILSDFYGLDLQKIERPSYLGDRWPTESERAQFAKYAKQDARVTSMAASYLFDELVFKGLGKAVPLKWIRSFGTISQKFFKLPMVGTRMGKNTILAPYHTDIRDHSVFAGRCEAFINGHYEGNNWYCDVQKMYPTILAKSGALTVRFVDAISGKHIKKIEDVQPWGWIQGVFETHNDLFGLPVRSEERNYYVTGTVKGLFHTYDLLAAKAKLIDCDFAYTPKFEEELIPLHKKFVQLFDDTISGRIADNTLKAFNKSVMNALTGVLGLHNPKESPRTNYAAYNTTVAGAHLELSNAFDHAKSKEAQVFYCDTDSIFSDKDLSGVIGSVKDPFLGLEFPVKLEVKGASKALRIARSKMYWQYGTWDDWKLRHKASAGWSAWHPWLEDFFTAIIGTPNRLTIRIDTKHTFRTKTKEALAMPIGRWRTDKEEYDYEKLASLFKADDKRARDNYNSYELFREKRCAPSRALTIKEQADVSSREKVWIGTDGSRWPDWLIQDFRKRANQ